MGLRSVRAVTLDGIAYALATSNLLTILHQSWLDFWGVTATLFGTQMQVAFRAAKHMPCCVATWVRLSNAA